MALFDKYKRFVLKLTEDDQYNHFTDMMEYFRGKDTEWFMFAQQARSVVKNGERKSSPNHISQHYMWQMARSNLRMSFDFKKFVENTVDGTDVDEDLR
jgi:hypothetical protein